jgi:hypothetical protein
MNKVLEVKTDFGGSPVPTLVSRDLDKIYSGHPEGAYAALLVNDWTGNVQYEKRLLFDSLQDYKEIRHSEIRLKSSGIILHILDAIKPSE